MAGLAHRDDRQGFHVAKAALGVTVDDDLANFELLCFGAVGDLDIEFGQLPRLPGVGGAGCRVTRLQADAAASDRARTAAAGLGLAGLLMPAGILGEVYLGLSPIFVLLGAVSMTASVVLTGVLALKHWGDARSAT